MTTCAQLNKANLKARKIELIGVAKRCFETGLQTNSGGNLSVRLESGDAIVIKPSGVGFNECTEENLMVCNLGAQVLAGEGKPSKDLEFHCEIYRVREDVQAIVHVHSPWAIGYSHLGLAFRCSTVQSVGKLGEWIPCIDLAPGNGPQGAAEVGPAFRNAGVKAALLRSHGTIGVGRTLMGAQYVVELLEETIHAAFVGTLIRNVYDMARESGPSDQLPNCFPAI